MRDPSKRILILSSSTGGGHQSAAWALQDSLTRLSLGQVLVNITQVLEEATPITRHLATFYNYLLRYNQHYMRYYYWAIEKIRPYESHMLFQLCRKYGSQVIDHLAPTTLVSVHPMTQHFFAYMLKKLRLIDRIPLITVVTDPCRGFWKGWACPEVSQYFVASDEAKAQLEEFGIPNERIAVSGMPVHSRFQPVSSLDEKYVLRQQLQLDPHRFTILVNAGWAGGGNIPQLYETLMQGSPENIQLVFMAGHNTALFEEASKLAQNVPFPVNVLPFTTNMHEWMNASDVMISKMGGLTTFEAMACQLPILADCLTPPMPQEQGTARFVESNGAGILIQTPHQLVQELDTLIHVPGRYEQMKQAAARIGRPGASDHIAREILQFSA